MGLQVHPHACLAAPPGAQGHTLSMVATGGQMGCRGAVLAQRIHYCSQNPCSEKCSLQDPFIAHEMQLTHD